MSEFVAITTFPDANISLKREALLFHRIGIHSFADDLRSLRGAGVTHAGGMFETLEWLYEQGVIFEPEPKLGHADLTHDLQYRAFLQDYRKYKQDETDLHIKLVESLNKVGADPMDTIKLFFRGVLSLSSANDTLSRLISIQLRRLHNIDAYPLVRHYTLPSADLLTTDQNVLDVVMKMMPGPDDSVAWEQVLEFRSDPDSWSKFLALRNWMSEVARAKLTPLEIGQKLEYLIDQYRQHMALHKMKSNVGALETIVISTAEFAEDLVKFKWGKIAKSLFSFRQRKVAVLEGELKSPGSEVAYIVKSQDAFQV